MKFNKEIMRNKKNVDLDTLHDYLTDAFKYIDKVRGLQCIIAFGNTGSGKSTMLNSLIYGGESIITVMKEEEKQVPASNGKFETKKLRRKTIDVDPKKVDG